MQQQEAQSSHLVQKVNNRELLERSLNVLAIKICSRLKLPPFYKLNLKYENLNSRSGVGGMYTPKVDSKEIKIIVNTASTFDTLLAAMCHEFTHYFMDYYGLKVESGNVNEIKTDLLANLIGFNKIIVRGYKDTYFTIIGKGENVKIIKYARKPWYIKTNSKGHVVNYRGSGQMHQATHVGYLTVTECKLIGHCLAKYRNEHIQIDALLQKSKSAKEALESELLLVEQLYNQLSQIDPRKIRNDNIETAEQVNKLNEAIIQYDSFNLKEALKKHREIMLNCDDIAELNKSMEEVKNISSKLAYWSKCFQGLA